MNLVPFSAGFLRRDILLPFALHDSNGRLLLGAGTKVTTDAQLTALLEQQLFVDETETANWKRRVQAAMDQKLRQGATLGEVAAALPPPEAREPVERPETPCGELWDILTTQLDAVLRDVVPGSDWQARLLQVRDRARQLLARRPDAALYCLVYGAGQGSAKYSSSHSLLTAVICELCAPMLEWPQERVDTLSMAALTMNVAMLRLQDRLAMAVTPLTVGERMEIERHPEAGAGCLQRAGVQDALWLDVVRRHHEAGPVDQPLQALEPGQQLARLLRRVDIFAAKISRRASRAAMSPVQAAREAFLGAQGTPDDVGGALLRAVGLYPPGSFVELVNGELAIVLARGRRSNLPVVAALVSSNGEVLMQPLLRDCIQQRHAVKRALQPDAVRVRPPHQQLLSMR